MTITLKRFLLAGAFLPTVFITLAVSDCAGCKTVPTPPAPTFDAAIVPCLSPATGASASDVLVAECDECLEAEARLYTLRCFTDGGVPLWVTSKGSSFAVACRAALRDPSPRDWRPDCWKNLKTCADVPKVPVNTPRSVPCP